MISDDAVTDHILRFPDGERVGYRLYKQGDGSGYVLLVMLAFAALFAFAWACAS